MKKMAFKAVAVLAFMAFAGNAFAASTIASGGTVIGGSTFTPSSNVTILAVSTSTAYAATSKHLNGTKEYGTLSSSPTILSKDATPGTASPTAPTSETALASGYN